MADLKYTAAELRVSDIRVEGVPKQMKLRYDPRINAIEIGDTIIIGQWTYVRNGWGFERRTFGLVEHVHVVTPDVYQEIMDHWENVARPGRIYANILRRTRRLPEKEVSPVTPWIGQVHDISDLVEEIRE
ncbi:hypothetical protein COV20_05290 [Candidatus Woesearchaeota archaeon CG10_big_fil_rev_8_21_14_0_10_45_16]|nr:MAG: hypothetical protein COV20_05290 [Candidatus Woesearchaeota archaeon CG10_big_fil_rev_8_21_14_0_10_45_16]